ncbi:MAG: hypothetical protein A3D74_04310 [Candidatus Levybacteria bacterium RIFCSPHIGHO2_02_FULL_37_13]|nr:MAG: hypothetical protein A3D74_04310 [Candidatus Levybacteria bacterium RIFCSPHIGHO2_02_FULL_37_13]
MGVLKVSFIILLLLFPLGQITRLDLHNGIVINLIDLAVGIVMLIFLFVNKSKKWRENSLTKPIIIFGAIGLLSLIINIKVINLSEFIVSVLYGIRWISYAGIFFVVSAFDHEFKKTITKIMLFVGSLIILGGYLQYFLYPNLRNLYYLGWDEHLYRMFSTFLDPNFAGAFFVLYFLFVFGLTMHFIKSKKKNYPMFLSLLSACSVVAIFLTYSRSALIMLIIGSTTLFLLKKQKKLIIMILTISVIFFVITANNFYIENLNLLRTASSKARLESASHAIEIIKDNPVLGVGFNAYRFAQSKYGFIKEDNGALSHSGAGTDNSFLFVLATTGVVGLISYLFIWFNIFKRAFRILNSNGLQETMSAILIASIVGIFANAFFINSLFYPSIMLWMWTLVGLIENKN